MEEEARRQDNDSRDTARTRLIEKKREWLSSWKELTEFKGKKGHQAFCAPRTPDLRSTDGNVDLFTVFLGVGLVLH